MYVPFESLPPTARLWIYQSARKFTDADKDIISSTLSTFIERWSTHGSAMKASFDIRYDHFVIFAADEEHLSASGCSIDDSVRTFKSLDQQLNAGFFDRERIAFRHADQSIGVIRMSDLKSEYLAGHWNDETQTFNNLITEKAALDQWVLPAGNTWLKRYILRQTQAS